MKRLLLIICAFFCAITFSSCDKEIVKEGVQPTRDFTILSSLDDSAIYQANSRLVVSGEAEANVVIFVEIIDSNGKVVESSSSSTDENNKKWIVSITTPKASYNTYSIRVSDSYGIFSKKFDNISFGKVWMFAGEFIDYSTTLELDKGSANIKYNINNEWVDTSTNNLIVEFAHKMKEKHNMPIGIISVLEEQSEISSWIPLNTIKEVNNLKNYLIENDKYTESFSSSKDMSYIFENIISKYRGMTLETCIFNHGMNDLDKLEDKDYFNYYFLSYVHIVSEFNNNFNNSPVKIIGAPSDNNDNVVRLRDIQNTASNYFSFSELIPTFDLNELNEEGNVVTFDLNVLVNRIISVCNDEINFSSYANLIYDTNEEEIVDTILIEFNNTDTLSLLESVDGVINYLDVYYNGEEIIKLENVCRIVDNFIVIDLNYEEITIVDEVEVIENKIYDKSLITISYAKYANLTDYNLVNDNSLPILPFKIDLNK